MHVTLRMLVSLIACGYSMANLLNIMASYFMARQWQVGTQLLVRDIDQISDKMETKVKSLYGFL